MKPTFNHIRRSLPSGGKIVVLDVGAHISSEAVAMLQALYSRSVGSVDDHISAVEKPGGAEKFMASYYVGYGHKSIGDCGTVTLFIEGVSMLAAKAIQDSPLYNGQESSTRYINFSEQPFFDPIGTKASRAILDDWRTAYLKAQEEVLAGLREQYTKPEGEKESVFEKALAARAFDVTRSLLSSGAQTNLAWHTTLRHAADRVLVLRHHPLEEVRNVAQAIEEALTESYPSSFSAKRYDATEEYIDAWSQKQYYFEPEVKKGEEGKSTVWLEKNTIDGTLLAGYKKILSGRPPKTELPKFLAECGEMRFGFLIDFGSFRDVQRHRAVSQRMPLVTTKLGLHPWYLAQLPSWIPAFLKKQEKELRALKASKEVLQYYIPMGYQVQCRLAGDIPALAYLVELRSGSTVHPTLRTVAQSMGKIMLKKWEKSGLVLHLDTEPDRFNVQRGKQDIIKRTHS